jgi:hypothetical protein
MPSRSSATYLQRLHARDVRIGCVNDTLDGRMCDIVGSSACQARIIAQPDTFGRAIACTTQESFVAPSGLGAVVIAASQGCFELAAAQARAAGIQDVFFAPAVHDAGASGPDGVVQAHRGVWRTILRDGRPRVVLEEDAHFIGDPTDVSSAVARCEAAACDVAYLGISGDFFTSHAYWATPKAALHLLQGNATRDVGNTRKPDYAMRQGCLGDALTKCLWQNRRSRVPCPHANLTRISPPPLRCLRPPRVLWRRPMEAIGLFVQNHYALTSYATLGDWNRAKMAGMNHSQRQRLLTALRERKCRQVHENLKRSGHFAKFAIRQS